jgi:MFS superfamily sulfate permease-like transporter
MAALGAVLVVTGWRLVSLDHVKHLLHVHGRLPALIWAVTFVLVVATDLLTGVLVGLALSLVELIPYWRTLKLGVGQDQEGEVTRVSLKGSATFLTLTRLTAVLEALPDSRMVKLDLGALRGMDHTTAQMLNEWVARRRKHGAAVEVAGPEEYTRSLMPA